MPDVLGGGDVAADNSAQIKLQSIDEGNPFQNTE